MVSRPNLLAALKRVKKNKGGPGIDGMTVEELPGYLRTHWPALRDPMLAGVYQPSLVKEQMIPKSGGGVRKLGIPTVLDRFVQQALLQVLQPMLDPGFSEHSHAPHLLSGIDEWIRHRLRAIHLKHWKRGKVIYRELRARGLPRDAAAKVAANSPRWWKNSARLSNIDFPIVDFDELGLPRLGT